MAIARAAKKHNDGLCGAVTSNLAFAVGNKEGVDPAARVYAEEALELDAIEPSAKRVLQERQSDVSERPAYTRTLDELGSS